MGTRRIGRGRHLSGFARFGRSGAAISLLAGLLVGSGCASYANVPEPESPASVTSPNRRQPKAVMTASLVRVLDQFPPDSNRFAVGLPEGVTIETIDEILGALGPGAELTGPETRGLPTYSIGRIWIRSGKSKVDIFRPVTELGPRADGTYERQAITVWLEGGLDPWHVTRTQRWEIGAFPRPDVAAWPEEQIDDAPRSAELDDRAPDRRGVETADETAAQATPREIAEDPAETETPAAEPPRRSREIIDNGVIRIEPVDD
ncbi:MAG: hypothetical protein RIB60_00100 [Phycisphaerales bacterium]